MSNSSTPNRYQAAVEEDTRRVEVHVGPLDGIMPGPEWGLNDMYTLKKIHGGIFDPDKNTNTAVVGTMQKVREGYLF
jgi:hypothetical protein